MGAAGQLGSDLVPAFGAVDDDVLPLARPQIDLERPSTLEVMTEWRPDIVVNSAAWTDVDGCALDPERAMRLNGTGAGAVAAAAARAGALVVQVSTNEVFDGLQDRPYRENDVPAPTNPYGLSKLEGEHAVAAANPRHLIIRTAWLFGAGQRNFPARIRTAAERARKSAQPLRVVADEVGNPTWTPDLAAAIADLSRRALRESIPNVVNVAGWPPASRLEWAQAVLGDLVGEVPMIAISLADYIRPSRVPAHAVLDIELARSLGIQPSDWRAAAALAGAGTGA